MISQGESTGVQAIETITGQGTDRGRGNLLGIQAWMQTADYASQEAYYQCLSSYLDAARDKSWLNPLTIAIFPEYIGTWLVAVGEGRPVSRARTINAAMRALLLAHPFAFSRKLLAAHEKGRVEASLVRIKAQDMANSYSAVFSRLAKTYGVTVVAGSILLPGARVTRHGVVSDGAGGASLQNVSAVFRPDGSLYPQLAHKSYPTLSELPFVKPAAVDELPVFETPAGRLGVLVCADSWYPAPYVHLKQKGVDILAVPSFNSTSRAWDGPWNGYNGASTPPDLDVKDVQTLNEEQAWGKYALAGRLASSGASAGINVFMHGPLWDIQSNGLSMAIKDGECTAVKTAGSALLNQWL